MDHEDYIKLSEKIDGLCATTREDFDNKTSRVHERIDAMHDIQIRHDERIKTIEKSFVDHMLIEEKRWTAIMRWLIFLSTMHVIQFTESFPTVIKFFKSLGF